MENSLMNVKKFLFMIVLLPAMTLAELKLPAVFSDSMVLQQRNNVKIWGWTDADANVKIKASWMCFDKTVTANKDGEWLTFIKTPKASSDAYKIVISCGKDTISIEDVLIGEIWLASGQSNMGFPLYATENANEVVHSANYPQIRFFRVPIKTADQLQVNTEGKWEICMPKAASGFSGAAYYFAKELHERLGVPIGIVQSAVGGTPIEAWMDRETLTQKAPTMVASYDNFAQKWMNGGKEDYYKQLSEYEEKLKEAEQNGTEKPGKPKLPFGPEHNQHPCGLYNGMIYPFVNYTIKGFIWYQGEGNT
jgi:sialate O-acetylesterase